MPADTLENRRNSTPTRTLVVRDPTTGERVGNITGWAFRFNALQDKQKNDQSLLPTSEFVLFSLSTAVAGIVISDGPNSEIEVAFGIPETGYPAGTYRAELVWRKDGTDPVAGEVPDDANEYSYRLFDDVVT